MSRVAVLLSLGLIVVAGATGCGRSKGGSGGTIHPAPLSRAVLQRADLAGDYTLVENGHGAQYEVPPGEAARTRTTGWIARFRLNSNAKVPLLVSSRIDVYPSVADARKQLADYMASFEQTNGNGGGPTAAPTVGDDSAAFSLVQAVGQNITHFYGIAWRRQNTVSFLQIEGVGNAATLSGAVALARAQDKRLQAAA